MVAAGMGVVMLSAALFSLQYAGQTQIGSMSSSRRTELRTVLDEAVKMASYLYHVESACDPESLDGKLARIKPDGTLNPAFPVVAAPAANQTYTNRYVQFGVNSNVYNVSFGPVTRIKWRGNLAAPNNVDPTVTGITYNQGTSQDAAIQVWTTFGTQRVTQVAALINNCTYPCSAGPPGFVSDQCTRAWDPEIAFHRIDTPAAFPTGVNQLAGVQTCVGGLGGRVRGQVKLAAGAACTPAPPFGNCVGGACAAAPNTVTIDDVVTLKNYLRSGDWAGSCSNILTACGDLNNDGVVDEMDLNILEKVLRGYLYWIPVHF
jgi:hypothetical protein